MTTRPTRPRLLIVDEHPGALAMAQTIFGRYGYETAGATSAAEAVEAITRLMSDVVVLEWSFRDGQGVGLTRRLRDRAAALRRRIVVVVLSVVDEPEGFCDSELVDEYFVKPAPIATIDRRIRVLLGMRCRDPVGGG